MTTLHRLDEVSTIIMGQAPSGDAYNTEGVGWPLIAGAGDFDGTKPAPKKHTTEASKVSEPGDIVLGIRASIGEKVLADGNYCLGRGVAALRPSRHLNSRFLWHWLGQNTAALAAKGKGATFKQVSRKDIGEMPISLPPLEEQRRIGKVLDQADALRTKRREAIVLLEGLAQAIFLDMFGEPISNAHKWEESSVERIADKVTDGEHLTPKREPDGIKLLSARNVQNGYLSFDKVDHIGLSEYNRISKRCDPRRGDVLISCSGTIGRVAPVETDEPFTLVRSVALIRPNRSLITTNFLTHYLRTTRLKSLMLQRANASSQANLFQGPIRGLPVFLPPLSLQIEFDQRVGQMTQLYTQHTAHLAELDALFASLQQRAFRGELWNNLDI
jgi:type I restriction enzyme S subunit